MKFTLIAPVVFLAATGVAAEEPGAGSAKPAPAPVKKEAEAGGLYSLGKDLFEALAPDEIKEEYEFISQDEWNSIAENLERALESGSLADLARHVPDARSALERARKSPEAADLLSWLEERVDLAEAAEEIFRAPIEPTPAPTPTATPRVTPTPTPARPPIPAVPHLELWKKRLAGRPVPARAAELMPLLKAAFVAEGVPPALAWLVEIESSFNPNARSPAGAKGLFQFMPATAESLGLRTFLPDERTHPEKSAQAAARYLKALHRSFADWPLVLAAYNAGEGRVRRALASRESRTFAAASSVLPAETQLYVPKVMATVALREGVDVAALEAPRG